MASFVKGASADQQLEKVVGLTWIIAFHLRTQIWFEWVDSNSNWSDGISRDFGSDEVSKRLGFKTGPMKKTMQWWSEEWKEVWRRAEQVAAHCRRTQRKGAGVGGESPPAQ